jgi:4-amino-4-deoxy-L-arabinose transferase-like glycosyltransferase
MKLYMPAAPRTSLVLSICSITLVSGLVLFARTEQVTCYPYENWWIKTDHMICHVEEPYWITTGFYCTDLVTKGDFSWNEWKEMDGATNMQLGKLLIGMPLRALGKNESYEFYNWGKTPDENQQEGRLPPKDTLLAARKASAVFSIGCCVALFILGASCTNRLIGFIAWALLISNATFLKWGGQARVDSHYMFFLLCLPLTALLLIRSIDKSRFLYFSCLMGAEAGLACSVKITGLPLGMFFFILLLVYIRSIHEIRMRTLMLCLVLFSLTSLAAVYSLNPLFWPSLDKIELPLLRDEIPLFIRDAVVHHNPPRDLEQLKERYAQLSHCAHPLEFPAMPGRWDRIMEGQIAAMGSGWKSNRYKYRAFHEALLFRFCTFRYEWIFLCIGFIVCASRTLHSVREKRFSLWSIPLLYFLANYLFIFMFMKLNWPRYYLPTLIAGKIVIAVGIYATLSLILHNAAWPVKTVCGSARGA